MAEKLTKRQWLEIAVIAFFLALLGWLINHAFGQTSQPTSSSSTELPPPETSTSEPITTASIPSIGFTPTPLPGAPSSDSCGCNGCATSSLYAGGSIGAIVSQTNAYNVALDDAINSMMAYVSQYSAQASQAII